jgi:ubiquinone/menaquinone biosynthesis C-methylase UbiE
VSAVTHSFDDALGYEQFMGRWSRTLGQAFLQWLSAPRNVKWLDVGCGTGIVTQMIWETGSPAAVIGIDCAAEQIEHARRFAGSPYVEFRVADAQLLPFPNASFDVVASTLAINFIPDRLRGLAEMRRVARPGGLVAGCVWDFAAELSPSWPVRVGMSRVGMKAPPVTGSEDSSLEAVMSLFQQAGLEDVTTTSIEVTASFASFDELWRTQTPTYAPLTKAIAEMPEMERAKLKEVVGAELPILPDGSITFCARANAARGRAPE